LRLADAMDIAIAGVGGGQIELRIPGFLERKIAVIPKGKAPLPGYR
jgi:hypothetical protein